jgi:hypothetical protein
MANFTDRELMISQVGGGIAAAICLIMGITGKLMISHNWGAPEYATCLRNSGWTLLIICFIWLGLASWLRFGKK